MKKLLIALFLLNNGCSLMYCQNTTKNIRKIVESLSLEEKIGQLFIVGAVASEISNVCLILKKSYRLDKYYLNDLIRTYKIGGILWYGEGSLNTHKKRANHYKKINHTNPIPLWFARDLEPNFMNRVGINDFATSAQLGMRSDSDVQKAGEFIGTTARALDIDIVLAPVVDVHSNPDNPVINNRSFGSTAQQVTKKAQVFIKGLQQSKVLHCLKHFPGHGDTATDSHKELPSIKHKRKRLDEVELNPFKNLIKNNAIDMVMIAHLAIPCLTQNKEIPASLSKKVIKDVLQDQLKFKGLVITDGLDMNAVTHYAVSGQLEVLALCAGNDILLAPVNLAKAVEAIKKAVLEGVITIAELDAHVIKIVQAKSDLGLF